MTIVELWRRLRNIIVTAEVVETQASAGKMLVKVKYSDESEEHVSHWLPVFSKNNAFMKIWKPVLVGEQVVVLRPLGENDGGIVFSSLHHVGSKEPNGANAHTAIVAFSDGCVIKYDTQSKTLSVDACTEINLVCSTFVCHGDSFFKKNVDITGALDVGADITTDGSVTDALGDLSNFTTTDGSGRA